MFSHIMVMVALLGIGFRLGRLRHPANLKLANIKIAIQNFEMTAAADAKLALAKIKSIL